MNYKMSLKKSLRNDFFMGLPMITALVSAGLLVYFFVSKKVDFKSLTALPFAQAVKTESFILLLIFSFALLLSLFFFVKRILYIKSFENECEKLEAVVTDIHYVKDRCGVDVEFSMNGEQCKKHFVLFNNSQTKFVHMDSVVTLLVKDGNPKKSLILDLCFDQAE